MANLHRGEIDAELDGKRYRLCLTLGALAELESLFDAGDILALVTRITTRKLRAAECISIIGAGLRAGGHDVSDAHVARMHTNGGVAGFIDIVARLLAATFDGTPGPSNQQIHSPQERPVEEGLRLDPFPGAR